MATRRRVLGDAHVNRAEAAKTAPDAPFQALITDAAWGHVWSRDTITLRERSMLTIALAGGSGQRPRTCPAHPRHRQHRRSQRPT